MKRKIYIGIGIIFILFGVAIFIYPIINKVSSDKKQDELKQTFQKKVIDNKDNPNKENELYDLEKVKKFIGMGIRSLRSLTSRILSQIS